MTQSRGLRRFVPKRRCAWCRKKRKPRSWADYNNPTWCCSRSCASLRLYHRCGDREKLIDGTKAANRRRRRATAETLVNKLFGELSVREIGIFNVAMKVGYSRGYAKGYALTRRAYRRRGSVAA